MLRLYFPSMKQLQRTGLSVEEERVAWEGLARSCSPPLRRLGAFMLVGFTVFVTATTAVVLAFNLFGARSGLEGQGVPVPQQVFYATAAFSLLLALGGFGVWLARSRRSYAAFAAMLERGGLDPRRPTAQGLRAYSDEQLLALRSRYERSRRTRDRKLEGLLERTFGFREEDSFTTAPLGARPGTFEMNALRVDWESNLLLRREEAPEISWRDEGRYGFLPRRADDVRRLHYALRYTGDSVRELKRRYGYRADRWHDTVPEGKLFDALRDHDEARYIRAALSHKTRG